MQQQIQIHQRPEQVLNEAANFFAKRRAKVTDRTERGDFSGLRERLGMPPPERPPRPPQRQAPPDRAPEPVDTTPVDIAPPPPQAAAAEEPGTSGAAGATTVAPDESLPADVQA